MALTLTPTPYQTVLDDDGNPVSGAKVNTYLAGTTTAASTYTTSTGDVANANPIVADSAGRFVAYLSAGLSYKFVTTTSGGDAIDTQDNILAVPGASVNLDITGTAGEAIAAGEVCYISAGDGSKTAGLWYLADADNAYSSTTAVEIGLAVSAIAINTSGTIRLAGEATTATSVVVGTKYYVSATAGAITSSAPALSRLVGIAPTTTTLILNANTLTLPIVVSQGGTGKTSLTAYGVLLGGTTTTGAIQPLTPAAAGQLLKSGGTGAVAAWTDTPSVAGLTLSTPLAVGSGGTGLNTLTSASVIVGAGTSDVTFVAPGTSGNVLTSNGSVWSSTAPASPESDLGICEGRLTLTSGTPVTTADVTGATSCYFAPVSGSRISLYDGSSGWDIVTFTQVTIALGTLTDAKPYDLFAYNNSGSLAFDAPLAWTNDTTRATALTTQDGVLVKTGATTRRYIGSFYTTAATTTEDSFAKRYLWNYYNRRPRPLRVLEATDSWAYAVATWRQANGAAANKLSVMVGWAEAPIYVEVRGFATSSASGYTQGVGIGLNSTSSLASSILGKEDDSLTVTGGALQTPFCSLYAFPAVGQSEWVWLEYGAAAPANTVFYGDGGGTSKQAGIHGLIDG